MGSKRGGNSTIKFYILSTDDYERSLSFLMKVEVKSWLRNTSCFCQKFFGTSFKPETACDGWGMVGLQRKGNLSILSSSEKAVEVTETKASIVPDINDHVETVYDRKVYIDKVLEIDDSDAKISFYEHAGPLSIGSIFCKPKKRDEIWFDFVNILCVVPVRVEVKRGNKCEKFVLENLRRNFLSGRIKADAFYLFFTVLDIQ